LLQISSRLVIHQINPVPAIQNQSIVRKVPLAKLNGSRVAVLHCVEETLMINLQPLSLLSDNNVLWLYGLAGVRQQTYPTDLKLRTIMGQLLKLNQVKNQVGQVSLASAEESD